MLFNNIFAVVLLLAADVMAISGDSQGLTNMNDRIVERAAAMLIDFSQSIDSKVPDLPVNKAWEPDMLDSAHPIIQRVTKTDFSS
jgi:hypothetical protein